MAEMAPAGDSLYVGVGFGLTNPKTPFDLSKAKGISFWAKGPGRVRFKAPDINTEPSGDRCTDCYNDFGVDIYLTDQWVRYTVPFEKMNQQPGWGDRAPALSSNAVIAVQWQFSTANTEYDIWFDNIELVGCAGMTRFSGFGAGLLSAAAGLLLVACGGEGGPRPDRLARWRHSL